MLVVDVPALLERLGIEAQRRGREWWACCPFHAEHTPSWQIRDSAEDPARHGFWRCLGKCHDGGGAIGLVMRLVGLARAREAYEWLRAGGALERPSAGQEAAAGGGIELGPPNKPRRAYVLPSGVRFAPFVEWPELARQYAATRNLGAEQVDRWGLGFAIDGKLHGRIVMPWRDARAKLGGYTARAYVPGMAKKYLEPAGDEGASVGWVYGEEFWPAPDARDRLVLLEGGFDGFAVERSMPIPWGAARGSNLTQGHIARFSTFRRIDLAVDPDGAGERFVEKVVEAMRRHVEFRRIEIPKGFDAAKIERKFGPHRLARMIESASPC